MNLQAYDYYNIRLCGRNPWHAFLTDSRIGVCSNHCVTGIREPDMLTGMTERGWLIALEVFDAVQSSRGEPGVTIVNSWRQSIISRSTALLGERYPISLETGT